MFLGFAHQHLLFRFAVCSPTSPFRVWDCQQLFFPFAATSFFLKVLASTTISFSGFGFANIPLRTLGLWVCQHAFCLPTNTSFPGLNRVWVCQQCFSFWGQNFRLQFFGFANISFRPTSPFKVWGLPTTISSSGFGVCQQVCSPPSLRFRAWGLLRNISS